MRRVARRNENHFRKAECEISFLCRDEVPEVDRVECSPHDADSIAPEKCLAQMSSPLSGSGFSVFLGGLLYGLFGFESKFHFSDEDQVPFLCPRFFEEVFHPVAG